MFCSDSSPTTVLPTSSPTNAGGVQWVRNCSIESSENMLRPVQVNASVSFEGYSANAGSNRKILIGGTGLIEAINKLDYNKVISANDTVTKWGIDFTELRSKFGTLYVLHSEVFDQCGHYYDGFVIDPEYITKYCHVPFRAEKLDLRKSGVRNTDAIVVTEASCLVLRYPQAHMRVTETSQS